MDISGGGRPARCSIELEEIDGQSGGQVGSRVRKIKVDKATLCSLCQELLKKGDDGLALDSVENGCGHVYCNHCYSQFHHKAQCPACILGGGQRSSGGLRIVSTLNQGDGDGDDGEEFVDDTDPNRVYLTMGIGGGLFKTTRSSVCFFLLVFAIALFAMAITFILIKSDDTYY